MTITSIEKTKKGRYSLFVDDEFLFSIHKDTFYKSKIKIGLNLSIQELEQLRYEDECFSAKNQALDILSRSAQSSGTLKDKLSRYYSAEPVDLAVLRMQELGLVNDVDYACRLARDCVNLRGYSLQRLKQHLRSKRLPTDAIDEALAQFEEHDETDPIVDIILKKYRSKIFDRDGLQKTIAALQRRGFRYEDIKSALRKIEDEELYDE